MIRCNTCTLPEFEICTEVVVEPMHEGEACRRGTVDKEDESEEPPTPEVAAELSPKDGSRWQLLNPIRMHRGNWYETTVRIRMTFYVFLSIALCQAVALSFITHIVFSIMANPPDGNPMRHPSLLIRILLLPLLLLFYAVITDLMVDVGLDGMATPSMSQWKSSATLLAGCCCPSLTSRSAEVGFLAAFEGLPLLYAVISAFVGKPLSAADKAIRIINHYFQGGIWAVFLFVAVFLVARLFLQSCEGWEEDLAKLYHSSVPLGHINRHTTRQSTIARGCCTCRCSSKPSRCFRFYLVFALTIDICVLVIFVFKHDITILLVGHFLVTAVAMCYVKSGFPLLVGRTFWVTLAFSYLVTCGLLLAASHHKVAHSSAPLCLGPSHPGYNQSGFRLPLAFAPPANSRGYGYQMCSMHWGKRGQAKEDQFGILDLAALAYVSAYPTEEEIRDNLHVTFDGTALRTWNLTHVEPSEEIGRWIAVDFPNQKTRVIAVRGTSTMADIYADLELYAGIAVFQVINLWTPVLNVMGDEWVMWVMSTAKPKFLHRLEDAVEEERRIAVASGAAIVLTGHGLGAALAGVAAARSGVQCLGFSSPGLYYQAYRLGVDLEALGRVFSNVQPSNDAITRLDHQQGSVSWVKCGRDTRDCHDLTATACELWSQCGDPRERDFRQTCSKRFTKAYLNAS